MDQLASAAARAEVVSLTNIQFNPSEGKTGASVTVTLTGMPAGAVAKNTYVTVRTVKFKVTSVTVATGTIKCKVGPSDRAPIDGHMTVEIIIGTTHHTGESAARFRILL